MSVAKKIAGFVAFCQGEGSLGRGLAACFVDVEASHRYRAKVNSEWEVLLNVYEKLFLHGDELALLPFCQGDVEAVM